MCIRDRCSAVAGKVDVKTYALEGKLKERDAKSENTPRKPFLIIILFCNFFLFIFWALSLAVNQLNNL